MAKSLGNFARKKNRPFTVLVEGNIGCGKTTFLNHFNKFDNVCVLSEPVDMWRNLNGHNLLDLMYKDTEKWSFSFQSYVQLTMLKMHTMETEQPVKLIERSIFSCRYCFIEKMTKDKKMSEPASSVLNEYFNWITSNIDMPVDLIVYLRSNPDIVYNRMMKRNRSEEQCVPLDYIRDLHKYHENWLYHRTAFSLPAPVLTLNADLDLSVIGEEYERFENCMVNKVAAQA